MEGGYYLYNLIKIKPHLQHFYVGIALATALNALFAFSPTITTIAIITIAINATIMAYSTAVAPSSSLKNLISFFNFSILL